MKSKAVLALGASLLAMAGVAEAQEGRPATAAEREARIQALEQRLQELETQLSDLKASTAADSADIRRIQTDAVQVTVNNGRPAFASSDGAFKVALRGLFQYDIAHYDQETPTAATQFPDLNSGANFRRARIGIEGTAFTNWDYALTYEAGGSGVEQSGLQQAWLEYAGWKPWGLTAPVRIRVGAYAVENTLEGATSNTDALFLERASIAEIVRGAFGGDGRSAIGVFANGDRLNVSAHITGSLIGNTDISSSTSQYDEQQGFVTRIGWLALRGENYGVHLGANYSAITQPADGSSTAGADNLRFRDRPELRVDDSGDAANTGAARLIDTGAFSAEGARAYGLEIGGQFKNFVLTGEYLAIDAERPSGQRDVSFDGYYVQGAWTITGEQHKWNPANGGFGGVRPTNNFDPAAGLWGAWEIAARYSFTDLNDNPGLAGAPTPAGGIRGGAQTITTFGLNWYPNSVVRFLLDLQKVEVDRLTSAGAQQGQDYNAIALRTQVSF